MPTWKVCRDDGTVNEVTEPEVWRWEALYTDGTILKQYGDDGIYHWSKEVDRSRLKMLAMRHISGIPPVVFNWKPEFRLIFFFRTTMAYAIGGDKLGQIRVCHVGYQHGDAKFMLRLMPDGRVEVVHDVDEPPQ